MLGRRPLRARRLMVAGVVLRALGCTRPPATIPARDDPAIAVTVGQRFDSLATAIRRLDVDRMLSFYATDSTIVRAIDGQLIAGRMLVERTFREGFASVRSVDRLVLSDRHLSVLGRDAAVLTVRVEEMYTDNAGQRTAVQGTWTSVWRRVHGEWRIVQDAAVHVPAAP